MKPFAQYRPTITLREFGYVLAISAATSTATSLIVINLIALARWVWR